MRPGAVMRPTRPRLSAEFLEDRLVPAYLPGTELVPVSLPRLVTGTGSEVRVYDGDQLAGELLRLIPFGTGFTGGVNVATADLTGDAVPDVVAGMASGGSRVKVFDGASGAELLDLTAFDPPFAGGVNVAVGRVASGGWGVVVGVASGGSPHVKVYDAATGACVRSFFAFDPAFVGGVSVAAGEVTADHAADVVVAAGPGGGPHVKAFDGRTNALARSFYAYDPSYTGGVHVAVTTLYGAASLVTGPWSAGRPVKVFGVGDVAVSTFDAFAGVGTRVAVANFRGEGTDTQTFPQIVVGAGPGGGPHVRVLDSAVITSGAATEIRSYFASDPGFSGGVSVAAAPRAFTTRLTIPPSGSPSESEPTDPETEPGNATDV